MPWVSDNHLQGSTGREEPISRCFSDWLAALVCLAGLALLSGRVSHPTRLLLGDGTQPPSVVR